jgi:hypothetical protein
MSDNERKTYFEAHILKLKAEEEAKKLLEEKQKQLAANNNGIEDIKSTSNLRLGPKGNAFENQNNNEKTFYFYNPTTVAYGKIEFKKKWGKRELKDNWRWSTNAGDIFNSNQNTNQDLSNVTQENDTTSVEDSEKFKLDFYLKQIPTSTVVIDSLGTGRTLSNYQLGVIYKEKFQEYKLAASKFETVLQNKPEEKLVLPSMYNLFKIYEIIDKGKAENMRTQIVSNYPNTRYAQILSGKISDQDNTTLSPEEVYKNTYKSFEKQEYISVIESIDKNLQEYKGDNILPKFELLKANAIGKLRGLQEYKKAINYVVETYPNTLESTEAQEIAQNKIPVLEQMNFIQDTLAKNWKIVYKLKTTAAQETKTLIEKLNNYIVEKKYDNYSVSLDIYNENENFVVVHGLTSKEFGDFFIELLREAKKNKIIMPGQVITSDNYSVIQIKKNYDQYLELKI